MFFNQKLRVGVASGLGCLLLAVAGCSSTRALSRNGSADAGSAPAGAAASAAPASASPAQDTTATQGPAPAPAAEQSLTADEVKPSAPLRYTVKRGDTLWGISSLFLRDPWLWPEIWYDNPQIRNPHRIYPGDVLVLAYGADGRPHILLQRGAGAAAGSAGAVGAVGAAGDLGLEETRLEPRLRGEPLEGAIPTIPYSAIAAFLSRPSVLSMSEINHAPTVLAFRDEHQAAGGGDEAYVRGLNAPVGSRFLVMQLDEKLRDPDSGRLLGYQGLYTATAVVVRAGDPAKVDLLDPGRETLQGDILIPDDGSTPLTFEPHAPTTPIKGRIIYVIDDVQAIGQYAIVAINRGLRQGVAPGTVLAVDQAGELAEDRGVLAYDMWGRSDTFARQVRLPNERAGTLVVFKAYDDMAYALVIGASETMQVADIVRNP